MSSFGPPPDFARDFRAHLALTAKRNKQWIFSKTTKKWYTPEEFGFAKEDIKVHRGQASAPQLILMDPRQALDIANAQVVKASKFIEEHSKRIWDYYNIEPKKKL